MAKKVASKSIRTTGTAPLAAPSIPSPSPTPASVPKPMPRRPTRDEIAKRAFEIWVAKGRPVGKDVENWKQAERELGAI